MWKANSTFLFSNNRIKEGKDTVEAYIKDTLHQGHRTKIPELTEPP